MNKTHGKIEKTQVKIEKTHSKMFFTPLYTKLLLIQDFGSSNGFRFIWYKLNTEGIRILPITVQQMLKEIDSKGSE